MNDAWCVSRGSVEVGLAFLLAITTCSGLPMKAQAAGEVSLFDGESLDGWRGKRGLWSVEDGAIVGKTGPEGIRENNFLVSEGEFENFVLTLRFKYTGGNSGIQFRSEPTEPGGYVIRGYQADIGEGYHGSLYDEKRRGMLAKSDLDWVLRFLKKDDWNIYEIRSIGNRITLKLNGLVTARYTERDDDIPRRGIIALQLHSGPAMEIAFKDIRVRETQPKRVLFTTAARSARDVVHPGDHRGGRAHRDQGERPGGGRPRGALRREEALREGPVRTPAAPPRERRHVPERRGA